MEEWRKVENRDKEFRIAKKGLWSTEEKKAALLQVNPSLIYIYIYIYMYVNLSINMSNVQ